MCARARLCPTRSQCRALPPEPEPLPAGPADSSTEESVSGRRRFHGTALPCPDAGSQPPARQTPLTCCLDAWTGLNCSNTSRRWRKRRRRLKSSASSSLISRSVDDHRMLRRVLAIVEELMRWCNELNVERPAAPTTGNHILDATLRRILERTVAQTTATHLLDVTLRRILDRLNPRPSCSRNEGGQQPVTESHHQWRPTLSSGA